MIAFYFAATWDWTGRDLESGLGGAETAIIHLARAFARAGSAVTVHNRTSRETAVDGVVYRPAEAVGLGEGIDVLITVSRVPRIESVAAPVKVHLSMEDSESWVGGYRDYLPHIDALFTISPHHTRLVRESFGVPPEVITEVRLGVEPGEYARAAPKVPGKLIYCSIPDCGLGYLAPVYDLVRRAVPGVSLVVTGDLTLWGRADPGLAPFRTPLERLAGVSLLGKVSRSELIRHQKSSVLHVYPCVCNELFCLSSMECQAAGTPTVAPAVGALASTVEDGVTGVLLPLAMPDPRAIPALAREIVLLLRGRSRLEAMAARARRRALNHYNYDVIVSDWLAIFELLRRRKASG